MYSCKIRESGRYRRGDKLVTSYLDLIFLVGAKHSEALKAVANNNPKPPGGPSSSLCPHREAHTDLTKSRQTPMSS